MISSEAYNFECFSNFQFKTGVTQIFKSNLANLYISRACRLLCSAVLHLNLPGHVNFYKQSRLRLLYFFPYKFIQNNPKNLDLLNCIGRVRLVLYSKTKASEIYNTQQILRKIWSNLSQILMFCSMMRYWPIIFTDMSISFHHHTSHDAWKTSHIYLKIVLLTS